MARKRDSGGYTLTNIKCIKAEDNQSEIRLHKPIGWNRTTKITEAVAIRIKYSKTKPSILAKRYAIDETTIRDIRKERSWKHI